MADWGIRSRGVLGVGTALLSAALLAAFVPTGLALTRAQDPVDIALDDMPARLPLFLEVYINGKPTNLIAEFAQNAETGALSAPRSELIELGIKPRQLAEGLVRLDGLDGVSYVYDDAAQTIHFTADNAALMPTVISANRRQPAEKADTATGAVVNYDLSLATGSIEDFSFNDPTLSLGLDTWLFSPMGRLSSTGYFRHDRRAGGDFLRLSTTYEYDFNEDATSFLVGDVISSSLSWGRSVRMGGVQLRRDFGLRRDLVTEPLLSFDGAAAVPSAVDVYIDNNRVFSGRTATGPFRFEDIPLAHGSGDALVVIRDEQGNVTTRTVGFFSSSNLLKKGVWDFSFEAGYAREDYGQTSGSYSPHALYSGSLRFGLGEKVTLSGHVEGKSGLQMFGLGVDFVVANRAEFSFAAAQSRDMGRTGHLVFGGVQTTLGRVSMQGSMMRATEDFADLAYVTAREASSAAALSGELLEFPRAQDVVSVSAPLWSEESRLGLSYVHAQRTGNRDRLVALNYSETLDWRRASANLSASYDFEDDEPRLAAFLTIPLGKGRHVQTNTAVNRSTSGSGSVAFSQALGDDVGDIGYSGQVDFGGDRPAWQTAAFLRTRYGRGELVVRQNDGTSSGRARFEGSVVVAEGHLAAGPKVTDSFALVDAGEAGVPVRFQNRQVARTGVSGRALVTGLASNQRNRISLSVDDIPAGVTYGVTASDVVPARNSGVLVRFDRTDASAAALVGFVDGAGRPIPVGSVVRRAGREDIVGYDGIAYLGDLEPRNTVQIRTVRGICTANFAFQPSGGAQTVIEGVACR